MRLDELAQALRDFEECLVRLGVSRDAAREATMRAETYAVTAVLERKRLEREI